MNLVVLIVYYSVQLQNITSLDIAENRHQTKITVENSVKKLKRECMRESKPHESCIYSS